MNFKHTFFLITLLLLTVSCAPKQSETVAIQKQVAQYLSMMEAGESSQPDLDKIKKRYAALSDILTKAGLKNQADLYMNQVENAGHMSIPMEGVEKTFQQAVVRLIYKELDTIQNNPGKKATCIDNAQALYGAIKPTAERREKFIGSETFFTGMINTGFSALRAGKNTEQEILKLKDAISDIYFLSVLYELEGLASNRGMDDVKVSEKQIEAYTFYDIIRFSARDKAAGKTVHSELAKEGNEINIDLVKANLKKAFPDKSARYSKKF